jgi:hypothetical protein
VDADGDYEAGDLAWHIGDTHTQHDPNMLGSDSFIDMNGVPVSDSWTAVDAESVSQW